ncbi:MAG: SH3 domain-containing protein [Herpetosiphonaceae bacterium]|nr:SH3 domain-containing protein [Herpetosiphonaceae bacterium]
MERAPIYQTCSTRVLYYRRSHWVVAKYALAVVLLVTLGALLGRGLQLHKHPELPLAPTSSASTMHQSVIDRLAAPTVVAAAERDQASVAPSSVRTPQAATTTSVIRNSPTGAPAPALAANGGQWQVVNTGGLGLCLRPHHDLQSPPLTLLPDGMVVTALDQEVIAANHTWRHVSVTGGMTGWVASDYLVATR